MKNNITENKLPDIKTPKTQKLNKSYNSCSDIINQNPENHCTCPFSKICAKIRFLSVAFMNSRRPKVSGLTSCVLKSSF